MVFTRATKQQALLRCALFGPSGAGKTFTALRIATGMGGPIALIDTERCSASKYGDRFEFDTCDLSDRRIDGYIGAITEAGSAGYRVLIIDSLSHAWQELLTEVDRLAKSKYQGNTWSAWSDGTPKQRKLVDALLRYPGHLIATMRTKTEWTTEQGSNSKSRPVRIGLAPEQGKGIEYEFDLLLELNTDHIATVIKDRTGKFQDEMMDRPGEEFGRGLIAWLNSGEKPAPINATQLEELAHLQEMLKYDDARVLEGCMRLGYDVVDIQGLTEAQAHRVLEAMHRRYNDMKEMEGAAHASE